MCGIAGILSPDQQAVRTALRAMVDAQYHRGPDDQGEEHIDCGSSWLGLGQRRLSILDLSPAGHQPMVHPQTKDQIIFNGEIYNFAALRAELEGLGSRFVGHCDTEVLLHALSRWGAAALPRLQGMYAFAFYSASRRTILLARDPAGIKPLYIANQGNHLIFASEVRAILASGLVDRTIDRRSLAGLLAYGCLQQPCTLFANIRILLPGHYQVISIQDPPAVAPAVPFWKYPAPSPEITGENAVQRVRQALDQVVRDHLVADVPVGVFLSSGIDSSVIAGLAAKHHPHIRSFTVGFSDEPDLSEDSAALETARVLGLDHTNITINGEDAQHEAVEWLLCLDQPSMDGLNVYIISKHVRAQGVTVALSGQGGDELFGGYSSFSDVGGLARLVRILRWIPRSARGVLANTLTFNRSSAVRQKLRDVFRTDGSVRSVYFHRRRAMSSLQLARLGIVPEELGLDEHCQPPEALAALQLSDDVFHSVSCLESQFYQGNMLLRDADTNSMAHSLEIRVPMLDQRMLELAHRIPGSVRKPPGQPDKHLLRAAFTDYLRPDLLARRKMGFTLPIRRWMLGPIRKLCETALDHLKSEKILKEDGVDQVWKEFLKDPESPIWSRAFLLVVLGCYLRNLRVLA